MNADIAAKLQHGFALLQRGQIGEALALARDCAAAAPRNGAAHHLLAIAAKASGDQATAERAFHDAAAAAPNDARVLVDLGNWYKRTGRAAEALSTYERAVAAAPDFALAWINLGIAATGAGDAARAIAALETATRLDPRSGAAWQGLGQARRGAGDLDGAAAAFRKGVEAAPQNPALWISLGVALRFQGRPGEALPCFAKARALGFRGPELDDAESGARLDLGDVAGAAQQIEGLTRDFPGYVAAHAALAHLRWEHGAVLAPGEDAFAPLRAAARAQPQNWPLQIGLVRFLVEAKRCDEALAEIAALSQRPGAPDLSVMQANALESMGRSEEAHALYEEAYRRQGDRDPLFLGAYIFHLLHSGRIEQAAERAEATTKIHPTDQVAWAYLGTAWRLLNDPREHWLCDYERLIGLEEVEPPAGFADQGAFLEALIAALEPMHQATREPLHQSLRGGSQTPGRLFGRSEPIIAAAHQALIATVERWVARLPEDAAHPFLSRAKRSVREVGSWSVKLWSAGKHVNHVHPEGWMSSAFYVSLPPSVARAGDNRQGGWIQFGQPQEQLDIALPPRRMIQPRAGCLALFPSYMWHGTVPFEDDAPRMTIAFDMQPID